jgi:hypothetical protein
MMAGARASVAAGTVGVMVQGAARERWSSRFALGLLGRCV